MPRHLYETLELNENATPKEIRKQYRKLALKYHPDRNKNNKEDAKEKFQRILQAYEILSNEEKRRQYDNGEIDENGKKIPGHSSSTPHYQGQNYHFFNKQDESSFGSKPESEPATYYFFNQEEAANQFKQQYTQPDISTYIYVIHQSLSDFFNFVQNDIEEESSNIQTSYQKQSEHDEPHVRIEADDMEDVEKMIDRVLMKVAVELLFTVAVMQAVNHQSFYPAQ